MTLAIEADARRGPLPLLRQLFLKVGVLPFFLAAALILFTLTSGQFLTIDNMVNVARQSVYLTLVSLGQMLVLITAGFDLSVGAVIAVTSVVSAIVMVQVAAIFPDLVWLAIAAGALAGLTAGLTIGAVNGIGVAWFGVSPFIMTLGAQSVGAGVALFLTGGVPVSGLPTEFAENFGFGRIFGVPAPVLVALSCIGIVWLFIERTRTGRHVLAVGGNLKAARLSGIDTGRTLVLAYGLCALLASIAGLLLTARVESGESNLGGSVTLESIAACVIAGVSLHGGMGRVENVVLGAFFIVLVQNGMNLAQIGSYMQMVLLGLLLVAAVIADRIRFRWLLGGR